MSELLPGIEFDNWIVSWTSWVGRGYNSLGFFWVLVYRLAVLSLPPGDDKDSGTRCCVGFGWLRGKRLGVSWNRSLGRGKWKRHGYLMSL